MVAVLSVGALALLSLVVTAWRARGVPLVYRVPILLLRLLAWCVLLLAVAGPTVPGLQQVMVPGVVAVVIDTSRSMGLPARAPGHTRLSASLPSLRRLAADLERSSASPEVVWYGVDTDLVRLSDPWTAQPRGPATDLRQAVRCLGMDASVSRVVMVTDGADTVGNRLPDLVSLARTAGKPLLVLMAEAGEPPPDVAVDLVSAPTRVRAGHEFELSASVRVQGYAAAGLRAEVTCNGQRVRSLSLGDRAGAAGLLRTRITAGKPGRYTYALRVRSLPGEVAAGNNSGSAIVEVVPDKPVVLVIAGAPSPEYAALKRALLADPDLQVRLTVRKAPPSQFWRDDTAMTQTPLTAPSLWDKVSAVVLQDVPVSALGSLPGRLVRMVRDGSGLAVLGGENLASLGGSALREVLPLDLTGAGFVDEAVRPQLASVGGPLVHWQGQGGPRLATYPAWRGRNTVRAVRPGADVPLRAAGAPLLVSWQVGRGRAAVLLSGGTHRWQLSPQASAASERALAELFSALLAWLTEVRQDQPVVAHFDRQQYQAGAPARLMVQVADAAFRPLPDAQVTARVRLPDGATLQVPCLPVRQAPGRYEATLAHNDTGPLRATVQAFSGGRRLGTAVAEAQVIEASAELMDSRPDQGLLELLAAQTAGAAVPASQAARLSGRAAVPPVTASRVTRRQILGEPWVLVLLLVLWSADWAVRRRWCNA